MNKVIALKMPHKNKLKHKEVEREKKNKTNERNMKYEVCISKNN